MEYKLVVGGGKFAIIVKSRWYVVSGIWIHHTTAVLINTGHAAGILEIVPPFRATTHDRNLSNTTRLHIRCKLTLIV